MIDAGKLDRRVQFLRPATFDDGYQVRPGEFAPFGAMVWASKTPVSDGERYNERFRNDQTKFDFSDRFVVRWSPLTELVTTSDRLSCEGVVYGIVRLKEMGRHAHIEITAVSIDQ